MWEAECERLLDDFSVLRDLLALRDLPRGFGISFSMSSSSTESVTLSVFLLFFFWGDLGVSSGLDCLGFLKMGFGLPLEDPAEAGSCWLSSGGLEKRGEERGTGRVGVDVVLRLLF